MHSRLAVAVTVATITLGAVLAEAGGGEQRFQRVQRHMGTEFTIVLYARDEDQAGVAFEAAFRRAAELDRALSDYDLESELSRLSRAAPTPHPVPLSDDLLAVLSSAQQISRQSDGAFDVTVGPLTRLWRRARRQRELPAEQRLAAARRAVGYRLLEVDAERRTARLARPEMRLDLGGIAKGYAAQQMQQELRRRGVEQALVNAGGDIVVSQAPPGSPGWKVGVMPLGGSQGDLGGSQGDPAYIVLVESAVATSGDAWQYVELDGVRYSHIVDPRTGLGTTRTGGVTVIARDGATSDALASALSVLDVEAGLRLIEATPGAAARVVWQENGELLVRSSTQFPELKPVGGEG